MCGCDARRLREWRRQLVQTAPGQDLCQQSSRELVVEHLHLGAHVGVQNLLSFEKVARVSEDIMTSFLAGSFMSYARWSMLHKRIDEDH